MTAGAGSSEVAAVSVRAGLVSRTRPLSPEGDLLSALGARFDGATGFAWLHDGGGLVASGVAARVPVDSGIPAAAGAVEALLEGIDSDDPLRLPGTGPIAVGALAFGVGSGGGGGGGGSGGGGGGVHGRGVGDLVVPAVVVGRTDDGRAWMTTTGPGAGPLTGAGGAAWPEPGGGDACEGGRPGRFVVDGGAGRSHWTSSVHEAVEIIGRGPLAKVVLARQVIVEAGAPFDLMEVLLRLRRLEPGCFVYAGAGIVGASPELLVRRRGGRVVSRPMAGSTGRGATAADDDRLAERLEGSGKELDEHRMVVDAVREGLEAVCHQVVAGARPEVVRLATVAHLATTVVGQLRAPAPSALALAGLLHPTPAVAGMPRQLALETIARLEGFDRGLYGGPVGWVDSRGDGDWAVALRCAQIDGGRARLTAGAGIVADSDADAEWAETQVKLEPMLRALVQP